MFGLRQYSKRPLHLLCSRFLSNEKPSAVGQTVGTIQRWGRYVLEPKRFRSILMMFGAYLIFAYSMYNLKSKMKIEEHEVNSFFQVVAFHFFFLGNYKGARGPH